MRVIFCLLVVLVLSSCATQPTVPANNNATPAERNEKAAALNTDLGAKYVANGDFQLADDKLKRALQQNPRYAPAHWTYALLQERLGQFDLAEKHFRTALSLDETDSRAHNNFGTFLCKQKRYREADEHFKTALSDPLYPFKASANLNAGVCAMALPDYPLAKDYFQEVLLIEPGSRVALYQMAKLHFETDRLIQSRGYMKSFERVSQHTAESLWLAYRTEHSLGNAKDANAYSRRLESTFPDSREAQELQLSR